MKKTYFKKSLSVIMAVLMIMSCWVFVAPEHNHAEAINYGTNDINQVTGYVTIDPVIYTHGTNSTDAYSYMMYGSTIADGTYAGEFHTNISVSGKTLSSITVVDSGNTLQWGDKAVWLTETNGFQSETVLYGDLGGGYGYNTSDTNDATATLKFLFSDGTYELRTLYVKTNPVAQHAIVYDFRWNSLWTSDKRRVQFETVAMGSYGKQVAGTAERHDADKDLNNHYENIMNFKEIYTPYNNTSKYAHAYDFGIYGLMVDTSNDVNKYAGYAAMSSDTASNSRTTITTTPVQYYLDISSGVNSGIISNGNNSYSFKIFVGDLYNDVDTTANPIRPMNYDQDNSVQPTLEENPNGMSIVNDGTLWGSAGVFNGSKTSGHTGFSTITFNATSAGELTGKYQINYQHVSSKSATGQIYMPYSIKVVDKSALRNVYNSYVAKKLEAKYYTSKSWNNYSNALLEADLYLNNYEADTANESTLKANLETAYKNLVLNTFDISYENLFSFSEWAKTTCRNGSGSGSGIVTVDEINGTITVDGTGDFYTAYNGTGDYYTVPVSSGTEYTLSYDVNTTGSKQAYVFFYDDNGAGVTGAVRNGASLTNPHTGEYNANSITFTVPTSCTKIGVRFGINGEAKAVFSNIALYSTARAKEVDLTNWTTRPYRTVFKYGETYPAASTPTRTGYTFKGWNVDSANGDAYDSTIAGTVGNQSRTLYSTWEINQYTVYFVNAAGNTVSQNKYNYGTKASAITVPGNTALTKDDAKHYTYSWPTINDLGASDVTYKEIKTGANHEWNNGVVTTDPTCLGSGVKTFTCTFDGCGATYTSTVDATGHKPTKTAAKAPTCTETGNYDYWYCSGCGKYFSDEACTKETTVADMTIVALGHDFNNSTEAKPNDDGSMHYNKCTRCNEYYNVATSHTWDGGVVNPDSTCTSTGTKTYTCTMCQATKTEEVEKKDHVAKEAVVENKVDATCTENGNYDSVVYCKDCGKKLSSETKTIPATGHNFSATVAKVDATCTDDGCEAYKQCTACKKYFAADADKKSTDGKDDKTSFVIKTSGHSYSTVITGATCTEQGYTTHTCPKCNNSYVDSYVSALGHEFEQSNGVKSNGNGTHSFKCTRCDAYGMGTTADDSVACSGGTANCVDKAVCDVCKVAYGEVDSNNHKNVVTDEKVDATCEAAGKEAGSHCSACNAVINEQTVIPAKGHDFSGDIKSYKNGTHNWKCTRCDAYGTPTGGKDATTECNYSLTGSKAGTCTVKGYETYTCEACGYGYSEDLGVDPDNHVGETYTQDENVVDGTCVSAKTWVEVTYCSDCKKEISRGNKTGSIDSSNHANTKAVAQQDATCTEAGYTAGEYCDDCGQWVSGHVEIPAKGHTEAIDEAKAPTCEGTGLTEGKHCSVCNEVLVAQKEVPATGHDYDKTKSEANLTRPVKQDDDTWSKGYYTYTCKNDPNHTMTEDVGRADYSDYEDAIKKLEALLDTDITDEAKKEIQDAIDEAKELPDNLIDSEQDIINDITKKLEDAYSDHSGDLKKYKVTFMVDDNIVKEQEVVSGQNAIAPTMGLEKQADEYNHYNFDGWDKDFTNVTEPITVNAKFKSKPHSFTYYYKDADNHTGKCGCGYSKTTEHSWDNGVVTTAPKCEVAGENTYTCSVCNGQKTEEVAALEHSFTNYVSNNDATCTVDGTKTATCDNGCGKTNTITDVGSALGHDEKHHDAKAATCKETGWDAYVTCSRCTYTTYKETPINPDNHVGETYTRDENVVNGTCVAEKTWDEVTYCKGCDKELGRVPKTGEKDAANHVGTTRIEKEDIIPGTCKTAEAWNEVTYCESCGEVVKSEPKTGAKNPDNHTGETELRNAKKATCVEDGYTGDTYYSCCDKLVKQGEVIPASGNHDYKMTSHTEPTCEGTGLHIETCTACGDVKKTVIDASGHNWTITAVDATCKEKAHNHYYCENCHAEKDDDYTGSLGIHKWYIYDPGKEATCTEEGYTEHKECLVCGEEVKSMTLPKLNHEDKDGDGQCDHCDGTMTSGNHACGCICHKNSFIMRIIYAIARFFWKIFKINKSCSCGHVHY